MLPSVSDMTTTNFRVLLSFAWIKTLITTQNDTAALPTGTSHFAYAEAAVGMPCVQLLEWKIWKTITLKTHASAQFRVHILQLNKEWPRSMFRPNNVATDALLWVWSQTSSICLSHLTHATRCWLSQVGEHKPLKCFLTGYLVSNSVLSKLWLYPQEQLQLNQIPADLSSRQSCRQQKQTERQRTTNDNYRSSRFVIYRLLSLFPRTEAHYFHW